MKSITGPLLTVLLAALAAGSAAAQTFPCLTGGGAGCRGLIRDTQGATSLQSTSTWSPPAPARACR